MSLWFLLAFTFVLVCCIVMMVHYAQDAAEKEMRSAKESLDAIDRFNEKMSKPIDRGSDLVRAMRDRAGMRNEGGGFSSSVSDSSKEND